MGLIVQRARVRGIVPVTIRPASTQWQINLRVQYSWNADDAIRRALREIGIAVAMITAYDIQAKQR